jgi:hypothetical protein
MDAIAALYESGLSIREVARRIGICFSTVRYRLIKNGLFRVKHKRLRNGLATCRQCGEVKVACRFPHLCYGAYLCQVCLRLAQEGWQLRRRGISNEKYQALFEAQGGKCAICGVIAGHRSRYGKVCRLAIDHDHRTGQVRGLLCNSCNRGLGRFKDSIEYLEAAIRYLKREQ